jgi:hypothetical protein
MARTQKRHPITEADRQVLSHKPVSKAVFIRETLQSCRSGQCCNNESVLNAAYEEYVNNPRAPWNKQRRFR